MIVVCVKNENYGSQKELPLTIGKEYEVLLENQIGYYITGNDGIPGWYFKSKFSREEWRDKQIDKILE
jgi:hypothetical protein